MALHLINHWYIAFASKEVKRGKLYSKTILGRKILIYRDSQGVPAAIEDRCCHRNVPLSLGWQEGDAIVCGYHGWQYDRNGQCIRIPSQPDNTRISPAIRIDHYAVREHQNLIWIFMGKPETADSVPLPQLPEMASLPFTFGTYLFRGDLMSVTESLIDPYHINFVHRKSIKSMLGTLSDAKPDFGIRTSPTGFTGTYLRPNTGSWLEKLYFSRSTHVPAHFEFYYPNLTKLDIHFEKRRLIIYEHIHQVKDDLLCMMQFTLWENIFSLLPGFASRFMKKKSDKIVREDLVFLTAQQQSYDPKPGRDVSIPADEISITFRKFWREKESLFLRSQQSNLPVQEERRASEIQHNNLPRQTTSHFSTSSRKERP